MSEHKLPLHSTPARPRSRSFAKLGVTCGCVLVVTALLLSLAWPARTGALLQHFVKAGDAGVGNGSLVSWFSFDREASMDMDGDHVVFAHNTRALRAMMGCMQTDTCAPNQVVVLLEEYHLHQVFAGTNWVGGELIWANSTVHALDTLGYTYLFVETHSDVLFYYNLFPELVVALFADQVWLDKCWKDQRGCVKSAENPNGIPIWKLLSYYFWADELSPLDGRWVLAPEPWQQRPGAQHANTYLGYSIDERCTQHDFVPAEQRAHRAYVFAKFLHYIAEVPGQDTPAWPSSIWNELNATGIDPVVSLKVTHNDNGEEIMLPNGLSTLPSLGPDEFVQEIAKSKVLIGVGNPVTSPTPYEALCMGVPFINPILAWDDSNPDDQSQWLCQHDSLCRFGPGAPYVYNVRKGDTAGLLAAVQAALENPIERHVVERMTQRSVVSRLDAILRRDLEGMARELLDQRAEGRVAGEMFFV